MTRNRTRRLAAVVAEPPSLPVAMINLIPYKPLAGTAILSPSRA